MAVSIFLFMLLSSFGHALWNAISKRVEDRDSFFTLILGIAILLYFPCALYLQQTSSFPVSAWKWVVISTVFEILYFVTLAKAYQTASYSSAYPVVRGTAPLFTALFSVLLAGASLSAGGISGILLIVAGILLVNQTRFSFQEWFASARPTGGLRFAFLAGIFSAGYNLIDSMAAQEMSAVLYKYAVFVGLFAGKFVLDSRRGGCRSHLSLFRQHPWAALAAGILVFGANAIVVYAMQTTAVAYVAAVREMSIVFSAWIGLLWLKEKIHFVKWISIVLILGGVLLIKFQS